MILLHIIAVAIGGGAGALVRWQLARWWLGRGLSHDRPRIPWPTFAANILACFVLGMVVTWFGASPTAAGRTAYLLLATGFCGGLSTLSTFALEVVDLTRRSAPVLSLGYMMLSAGAGLAALWLGLVLAA